MNGRHFLAATYATIVGGTVISVGMGYSTLGDPELSFLAAIHFSLIGFGVLCIPGIIMALILGVPATLFLARWPATLLKALIYIVGAVAGALFVTFLPPVVLPEWDVDNAQRAFGAAAGLAATLVYLRIVGLTRFN